MSGYPLGSLSAGMLTVERISTIDHLVHASYVIR